MKLVELSQETIEKIKSVRWDRTIEKHEGPEDWAAVLRYSQPDLIMVEGHPVLLPVDKSHHANMTILRALFSNDGKSLTLFLKDTTFDDDPFFSGFVAVCDRIVDEDFFVAILYHEWFVIERSPVLE